MKKRRIISFLLSAAMTISLLPTFALTASAETEEVKYRYYFANGKGNGYKTRTATKLTSDSTTWTETTGFYYAEGNVTINSRVTVNGTVALILKDGCNLTINGGISVNSGNTLEIHSQEKGTGALKANAGDNSDNAVIGGNTGTANGTVVIHGGNITAENNKNGAGIGGGYEFGGGTITIHSGTITTGNTANTTRGAGIGGGRGGDSGTITIRGGTINAKSTNGAGIGGGSQLYYKDGGHCDTVNIYGGTITATADRGAGIGGGEQGRGGNVTIENATVTVTSKNGSGIGGGYKDYTKAGTTQITDSLVRATGSGTSYMNHIAGGTYTNSLVFTGKEGKVYGTYTLGNDFTLDGGSTLNIDSANTLNLGSGKTIAVKGNMKVDGTLGGSGGTIDLTGGGTVSGNAGITLATQHNLKFNVDYRLTNLKAGRTSPHTLASSQIAYDDTFGVTNKNGYKLPETVTVDGATDFTYENGYINIRKDKIQKNLTITASAVPQDFTVTLEANGGKIAEGKNVTGYTYGTAVDLPTKSDMTRTGYDFYGWKDSKNLSGANFTKISSTDYGNKTYYAAWTPYEYKVHYEGNGKTGGSMNDQEHVYDAERALSKNAFEKEGCVFGHWNTKPDGSGTSFADEQKVKNLTDTKGYTVKLYAQWLEMVTFDVGNTEHVYKNGTAREITLVPKSVSNALSADDFTVKYYRVDENNDTVSTTPVKKAIESGKYLYVIDFANDDLKKTYGIKNQYSVTDDEIPNVDEHGNIGFMYINATIEQQEPISFDEGEASLKVGEDYKNTLKNPNTGSTVTYSSSNTDIAEVAADGSVTAKKAGTVTITAKSEKKDCTTVYTSYKLTIKKELSASDFTVTAAERTYDGTAEATVTATVKEESLSDVTDVVKATVSAVYDSADCGDNKTVTWTVTGLSGRNSEKYILSDDVTGTSTGNKINKATVSIICAEKTTRTYDEKQSQEVDVSAMANGRVFDRSNFTVMYAKKSDKDESYGAATKTAPKEVGIYKITVELTESAAKNYTVTQPEAQLVINSATQDVFSIEGVPEVVYYGNDFTLTTSGANGDVTFSSGDSDILEIKGEKAVAKKTGKVTITAKSEKTGYAPAYATKTIEVKKRILTPAAEADYSEYTDKKRVYDGKTDVNVLISFGKDEVAAGDTITATAKGAMINADAGKNKIVYVSDIEISGDNAEYYTLSTRSVQTTVNVEKAKITGFEISAVGKKYDGTSKATATVGSIYGVIDDDEGQVELVGSAEFAEKTVQYDGDGNVENIEVTFTAKSISGAKAQNYEFESDAARTAKAYEKINPLQVYFTVGETSFIYNGKAQKPVVTATDENGRKFDDIHIKYVNVQDAVEVGEYEAEVVITNDNYYTEQNTDLTVTISEADQDNLVITGVKGTVIYGDILDLTAEGGVPTAGVDKDDIEYTWTSDNTAVKLISGANTATPKFAINGAVGDRVEISVTKTVENYNPITASVSFVPSARAVAFDIGKTEQKYDGTQKSVSVTPKRDSALDSDLSPEEGEDYTVTYNGDSTAPIDAGTYSVKVEATGNFTGTQMTTLVIDKGGLLGSISGLQSTYTYGDEVSAAPEGVTEDDNDSSIKAEITYVGTGIYVAQTEPPKNAGSYTAILTVTGDNYNTRTVTEQFKIKKAPLHMWAESTSKKYGEANPPFTIAYDLDELKHGDNIKNVILSEPVASTKATALSDVGEFEITVTGGSADNYDLIYKKDKDNKDINILTVEGAYESTLTITGAQSTVDVGATFMLYAFYGNSKVDVTWGVKDGADGVIEIDKNGQVTALGAGTATITAAAGKNYNEAKAEFKLTVKKTAVNLSATDLIKTYNGNEQYVTIVSDNDGFVPSEDNIEVTYTLTTDKDVTTPTNVGVYKVTFAIKGTDKGYTGRGSDTMYINKATVTARVSPVEKIYGDEYTGEYGVDIVDAGGIKNEEVLAALSEEIAAAATYTSEGAAATAAVEADGYSIIPTPLKTETDNVKFTVENGTMTVKPAELTVKAKDVSREYGAKNPELEAEYDGFKNEETKEALTGELTLEYVKLADNDETPVGVYPRDNAEIKTTASGTLASGNYTISYADGNVEITPIAVKATAGVARESYMTVRLDRAVEGIENCFSVKCGDTDVNVTVTPSSDNMSYTLNGSFTAGTAYTVTIDLSKVEEIGKTHTITEGQTLTITPNAAPTGSGGGGGGGGGSSAPATYTVTFDVNGGSEIAPLKVNKNTKLEALEVPEKDGYVFDGWYTDKELTTAYDFDSKVTNNITLYAKWIEKETPDEPDEPTPDNWENPFGDVSADDWYFDYVRYANKNGLMNGTTETEFAPMGKVTRGMFVTVLYRTEGEPEVNKSIPFSDVSAEDYFANAVIWAHQNGIVNGVTETEFAPNKNITREQLAVIVYRYAELKGYDVSVGEDTNILSYADYGEISEYAVSAMQYAVGSGLMKGKTETMLNPKDNATRAEMAAILNRFIEGNK